MKIISLYYHNPIISGFEKMIKHFQNRGYRFISVDELSEIMHQEIAINDKLVFLSLDDGWRQNLKLIPLIEKYNVPICIFISTEPVLSGNFWWEYVSKTRNRAELEKFKNLPYEDFYNQLQKIKSQRQNRQKVTSLQTYYLVYLNRTPTNQHSRIDHCKCKQDNPKEKSF